MNALPEGWVEKELGSVATISSSKRIFHSDYVTSGIPFYRSKEVIEKQKGNEVSTELFITEEKFLSIKNKFGAPEKDDLLLTSVGTLGVPYLVQTDEIFYFKDGNLTWFRNYDELEARFLYYFFLSSTGKERLNEITIGSTQAALTIAGLKSIPVYLPPLPEQKAIADMLSSFDEKIELLREQNKTLETIAQTIFKEWFVNFNYPDATGEMVDSELGEIPKGWRVGCIGDALELMYGKALKTEDRTGAGLPVYGSNGVVGYHKDYLVKGAGIIVGRKGSMGKVVWCHDNFFPIDTAFYVVDKIGLNDLFFHYFLLKRFDFEKVGSDSAVPGLNRNAAYSINVVIPVIEVIEKFDDVCALTFNKIKNNTEQIQALSKTRDAILPKLMSGHLRVTGSCLGDFSTQNASTKLCSPIGIV
jgi:type I restriction enzyme S subunit